MDSTVSLPPLMKAVSFVLILFSSGGCVGPLSGWRTCIGPVSNQTRIALTDENRLPLSGASVLVTGLDNTMIWELQTDLAGTARADLPPGRYRVIGKFDAVEQQSVFEVREGCDTSVTVRLDIA